MNKHSPISAQQQSQPVPAERSTSTVPALAESVAGAPASLAATALLPAAWAPHADVPALHGPDAEHRYFRCTRLAATLSAGQCRVNRAKLPYRDAFVLPEGPPPDVQPWQCSSCGLALRMDQGRVPFFTAEEVLAGQARQVVPGVEAAPRQPDRPHRPHPRRRQPGSPRPYVPAYGFSVESGGLPPAA